MVSVGHLHLVAFDVPYPPSYGGVIDIFYKIKALHQAGVQIHLHCFQYGREESRELEKYCTSVKYYPRNMGKHLLFADQPYIVATRRSEDLMSELLKDQHPILFEGLHCCSYLNDPRLKDRKKIVRTHNIEHDYYRSLGEVEDSFFRRMYFNREADKLESFEQNLKFAQHILAISPADAQALATRYANVHHVMAFHPHEHVDIALQTTVDANPFALYHGNLEVGENNQAALFLVQQVFDTLEIPLVIAGNNPSAELQAAVALSSSCSLKANISTAEIEQLIATAQINVLPTFQATGIKLKLLAALFRGRHCLVNPPMVANIGLEDCCVIAENATSMKLQVLDLANRPFTEANRAQRTKALGLEFSNQANAKKILDLL